MEFQGKNLQNSIFRYKFAGKTYWMQAVQIAEILSRTYRHGYPGYKFVLLDFDEVRCQQEQMALDTPSEPEAKDIPEAAATVQEMYSRLLGEKNED